MLQSFQMETESVVPIRAAPDLLSKHSTDVSAHTNSHLHKVPRPNGHTCACTLENMQGILVGKMHAILKKENTLKGWSTGPMPAQKERNEMSCQRGKLAAD